MFFSHAERNECIVFEAIELDAVICIADSGETGVGSKALTPTGPQALVSCHVKVSDRSK
jgi:hypothetical protein